MVKWMESFQQYCEITDQKYKTKRSHSIRKVLIETARKTSEDLAENLKKLIYCEKEFCCYTFNKHVENCDSVGSQCPAEIRIKWIKLNKDDPNYLKGKFEKMLMVSRIISLHDHTFYENSLAKKKSRKNKAKTEESAAYCPEDSIGSLIVFSPEQRNKSEGSADSIIVYSPEQSDLGEYRSGIALTKSERIETLNKVLDRFKQIMINESTSEKFNQQLEMLKQMLYRFESKCKIPSPDLPENSTSPINLPDYFKSVDSLNACAEDGLLTKPNWQERSISLINLPDFLKGVDSLNVCTEAGMLTKSVSPERSISLINLSDYLKDVDSLNVCAESGLFAKRNKTRLREAHLEDSNSFDLEKITLKGKQEKTKGRPTGTTTKNVIGLPKKRIAISQKRATSRSSQNAYR